MRTPAEQAPPPISAQDKPWGVPGEEHNLLVVPRARGQTLLPLPEELKGQHGKYKIQMLLSRPGYPLAAEREHKFIDEIG